MSETPQTLRIKVGMRYWAIAVIHSMEPPSDLRNFLADNPDKPDVYLFLERDEDLRQQWIKAVAAQCGEEWKTCLITDSLTRLDSSLSGPCLVIGTQRQLRRFCNSIAPNGEVSANHSEGETSRVGSWSHHGLDSSLDNLPDPSEIPRFLEEGRLDPFGQNLHLLDSAWSTIAEFVGKLARQAHAKGVATALPYSPSGQDESLMKPWRMVVSLESSSDDQNLSASVEQFSLSLPDMQETDFGLGLIQRCLLVFTALSSDATTIDEWHNLSKFIEELGYILVGHNVDIQKCTKSLKARFGMGKIAAQIHSINSTHGDMNPGNFFYEDPDDQHLMGKVTVIDAGHARMLDHSITTLERAQDLAILKLFCGFTEWEAAKLGYRTVATHQEAEEVFQLI